VRSPCRLSSSIESGLEQVSRSSTVPSNGTVEQAGKQSNASDLRSGKTTR